MGGMRPLCLLAVVFLVSCPACSKKPACPEDLLAMNEKFVEHTKRLMDILRDNPEDCAGLLRNLATYRQKHDADLVAMRRVAKKLEALQEAEFNACHDDMFERMGEAAEQHEKLVQDAKRRCKDESASLARVLDLMR
jgi:hypothetical protein